MLRLDQQANFRAAEDDRLCAACRECLDHPLIHLARGVTDDAHAQLFIDDSVHRLAFIRVWHQHVEPLGGKAGLEEILLHGERGTQQAHRQGPGLQSRRRRGISNMQEGNRHRRLNARSH